MKRLIGMALVALLGMSCVLLNGASGATKQATPTQIPEITARTPTATPVGVRGHSMALCVIADETVYLRPAPNAKEYPLGVLARGTKVFPNGPSVNEWLRVSSELGDGWVNGNYVGTCVSRSKSLYDRSENILE